MQDVSSLVVGFVFVTGLLEIVLTLEREILICKTFHRS